MSARRAGARGGGRSATDGPVRPFQLLFQGAREGQYVSLELYSWLNEKLALGAQPSGSYTVPIVGDGTIRALLDSLSAATEDFARIVYDRRQARLLEYVALIVNDQAVELAGGLDRHLSPGDRLVLLPGISGG
ncbi:MAG: MoaD/ThiS family protein [Chloroflexi bacterium]|nr:MoaD/ThiS family protein [Chloroflexota bacterium]